MQRNLPRPTLDNLGPSLMSSQSLSIRSSQQDLTQQNPQMLSGSGHIPTHSSRPVANQSDKGQCGASYIVSRSGAQLSLGLTYQVSSFGAKELDPATGRATNVGKHTLPQEGSYQQHLEPSSGAPLYCNHIDELDFDHSTLIGRGSSGRVFDVLHTPSGLRVCVKQLLVDDGRQRAEVKRELDSLNQTQSRFIVDFYGAFFHSEMGVIVLVLELMQGSLLEILHHRRRLTEREAKAFAVQVIRGLDFLHNEKHLIHRDIKPANLLFHRSGAVKITDFGVSSGQRSPDAESVRTFVGSISYMSPERLEGRSYSYESDIWSVGITVCEAVTGFHPFQNSAAQSLTFWELLQNVLNHKEDAHEMPVSHVLQKNGDTTLTVSSELDDFVAKCICFERNDRAKAEELLAHPWLKDITVEEAEGLVKDMASHMASAKLPSASHMTSAKLPSVSPTLVAVAQQPHLQRKSASLDAHCSQPPPSPPRVEAPTDAALTPTARTSALMDDFLIGVGRK